MNRLWLLAPLPVLALGAYSWASAPVKTRATLNYRCELGRHVVALERAQFVSVMVGGRNYDLRWVEEHVARGQGMEWRVTSSGAALKRLSSGHSLANRCVQR
jgi:hypothetical protein